MSAKTVTCRGAFWRTVSMIGYEAAVSWLLSAAAPFPQEEKEAVLRQAGRENLQRIHITQRDLTGNRRRPGVFE